MKKTSTLFAALAVIILCTAGTAQAQHHNVRQQGGNSHQGGNFQGGNFRGGNFQGGDHRGDYRGGDRGDYRNGNIHGDYRGNNGDRGYNGYDYGRGRGGIDIIIGGGGYRYPNGGWNNGGWNNGGYYPSTRIVYEQVYDGYGRSYTISHVASWDNYYRGYVWYDSNGQLRVN
jgi:hypothetical protein